MRLSTVLQVKKRKLRNRIFTLGVIATGILSIAFAVITFYGQQAGNFVMTLDYDLYNRSIVLSEDIEFSNPTPRLMTDPIDDARDMTYSWLKLDEVQKTNGNFVDPDYDYVAYTFYLKNDGFETIDLSYHIRIEDRYLDIDEAIRVLIIEDGVETMYQKLDKLSPGEEPPYYPSVMPKTKLFLSDNLVTREYIKGFKPGQVRKYSILMWLEGYDPDTDDDVLGGKINFSMRFSIDTEA